MEHESVAPILTDLVAGRLDAGPARSGWTHVAGCRECQEVLATLHELRRHAAGVLPGTHPAPEALVRHALRDPALAPDEAASIERHLDSCPGCARERALTMRAHRDAGRGWSGIASRIRVPHARLPREVLAPAMAALAAVVAVSAWWVLIEAPRLRGPNDDARRELETLRRDHEALRAEMRTLRDGPSDRGAWRGIARILVLGPPRRGAASAPAVEIVPGQPFLPVLIDHDPRAAGRDSIAVRVLRQLGGEIVWQETARATDLWDAGQSTISLLMPAAPLTPGDYRLELGPATEPEFSRRFAVNPR